VALTGTLVADFSSFSTAVDGAVVKLTDFEANSGKVTTALNKVANSLNGNTIVAQATIAAEAVERIGGVSNLTAAELARVSATAQEAAAKLTAMGQDVPPGIQAIANAGAHVNAGQAELLGTLSNVAAAFGLVYSIGAAVDFLKSIGEEAHALNVLSLQTHINIEDLQVLTDATREFGVEGDQLGRALFQLQQRIAGGDSNVTTAYHLMGMSIEDVRGKDAMSLFMATEKGLGTLSGAIQDTAAKDLYGGRLGASMVAFSSGAEEAVAKARALAFQAGGESVKALAAYQDAVDRASHSVHAWTMELEGHVAQGFNVLTDAVDRGASKWSIFVAMVEDFATSDLHMGANVSHLATLLDQLSGAATKGKDITLASTQANEAAVVALDAHGQAAKFMAALELDSAKPLLDWQVQYLGHLKTIGVLSGENAAAIGVNADQLKNYEAGLEAASTALVFNAKQIEQNTVAWNTYALGVVKASGTATDAAIANNNRQFLDAVAKLDEEFSHVKVWTTETTAQYFQAYHAKAALNKQANDAILTDDARVAAGSIQALQQTYEKQVRTLDDMLTGDLTYTQAVIQHQRDVVDAAKDAMHGIVDVTTGTLGAATAVFTSSTDAWNASIMGVGATMGRVAPAVLDSITAWNNALMGATSSATGLGAALAGVGGDAGGGKGGASTQTWDQAEAAGGGGTGGIQATAAQWRALWANIGPGNQLLHGITPFGASFADGGLVSVGENGPEKVRLPVGSQVFPTGSGPGGGGVTVNLAPGAITLHYPIVNDLKAMQQLGQVVSQALAVALGNQGYRAGH
jgi:hypothetical protein